MTHATLSHPLRALLLGCLLATCAVLAVAAAPAAAYDDTPCGPETTTPWSSAPENPYGTAVQLCTLEAPLPPNGWVPVYDAPVPSPPGGPAPDPAGWLHGTAGQYFVCQVHTTTEYYHPTEGWWNNWWAWTISDDGHWGWVPEVFFKGGLNDEADGGLRVCPPPSAGGQPGSPPAVVPPPPVAAGPPPSTPCDPAPATDQGGMQLSLAAPGAHGRRRTITVGLGQRVVVSGTIAGAPHARVCVAARELGGAHGAGAVVTTDAHGRFSYVWHAGATTRLSFVRGPGVAASVVVQVRPAVTLRALHSSLRNGQVLRLTGVLRRKPVSAGVLVELQARVGSGWQTFGTTSTHRDGGFSYSYRFTHTTGVQLYALRARVPAQLGYPFATGASASVRVRVSG